MSTARLSRPPNTGRSSLNSRSASQRPARSYAGSAVNRACAAPDRQPPHVAPGPQPHDVDPAAGAARPPHEGARAPAEAGHAPVAEDRPPARLPEHVDVDARGAGAPEADPQPAARRAHAHRAQVLARAARAAARRRRSAARRRDRTRLERLRQHPPLAVERRGAAEQRQRRRRDVDVLGLARVAQRVVVAGVGHAGQRLLAHDRPAADDRERVVAGQRPAVVAGQRVRRDRRTRRPRCG